MFSARQLGVSEEVARELNKKFDVDGCRWADYPSNPEKVWANRIMLLVDENLDRAIKKLETNND
jgi:hypothetical protein